MSEDPDHIKEQGALRVIQKAVLSTEGVLFAHTGDGEGLTWKACEQNFVLRDRRDVHFGDVARNRVIFTKIGAVRLLGELVPFACEHACSANAFEADAQAADPGKEVNEPKARNVVLILHVPVGSSCHYIQDIFLLCSLDIMNE